MFWPGASVAITTGSRQLVVILMSVSSRRSCFTFSVSTLGLIVSFSGTTQYPSSISPFVVNDGLDPVCVLFFIPPMSAPIPSIMIGSHINDFLYFFSCAITFLTFSGSLCGIYISPLFLLFLVFFPSFFFPYLPSTPAIIGRALSKPSYLSKPSTSYIVLSAFPCSTSIIFAASLAVRVGSPRVVWRFFVVSAKLRILA